MEESRISSFGKRQKLNFSLERKMEKWECTACGYIYDPEKGDPENGVSPGTDFENLPEDWICPQCGVGKEFFQKVS